MELVYLWVEDYKNIHKQGFNFSPKFNCHYDGETLTVKDNVDDKGKKQYIDKFFGEDINVTAIVGKNGSGKSSLLEIIKSLLDNNMQSSNDFIILYDGNEYIYYSSKEILKIKTIKWKGASSDIINIITHSSNSLDTYLFMNRPLALYDFINDMEYKRYKATTHIDGLKFEMIKLDLMTYYSLSQNLILKYFLKKDNDIFNPDKFVLIIRDIFLIRKLSAIISYHSPRISHSLEEIRINLEEYIKIYGFEEKTKLYIFLMQLKSNSGTGKEIELILRNYINKKLPNIDELNEYIIFEDTLLDNILKLKMGVYYNIKDMKNILLEILEHPVSKNIFIDLYPILIYKNDSGKDFKNLSTGEKDLLLVLAILYDSVDDTKLNLILLDEIEAFFHPSWSKNIMNILFKELQIENNHLIFSTHSPFLLSDIPKQNIIFLDKDEKGNCKVLNHNEVMNKKQTFGANIHTLLSDSFFMEDGLMGEFAKVKINEIIEFHKEVEENKDDENQKDILKNKYERQEDEKPSLEVKFWDVQKIIGDEYLKQVLKNHLIEIEKLLLGKDKAKDNEIKRTEAYLESLKNG